MIFELPPIVDVLVVGGGPAGLAAATWLGRYRRSTVIVDAGQQRNLPAARSHGLLGRDPSTPQELLAEARAGLAQYPQVGLCPGTVTALHRDEESALFRAIVDGAEISAERVILATGVRDSFPQITGFDEHYGTDVYHCLACDGYTARDQTVIVLGSGSQLPAYAAELLDWAATVRIITGADAPGQGIDDNQRVVLEDHGIEVVDGIPQALLGAPGALTGVQLAGGELVEGDTVFFSYGHHPANDLAQQLGCDIDDDGQILVNGLQLTSIDGVYAAGDLTVRLQLVPIAIGTGTTAGIACATSLRGHATHGAAPDPAPPTRRFTAD